MVVAPLRRPRGAAQRGRSRRRRPGRARCASASARSASTTSTSTCATGDYRLLEPPGAARHGGGGRGARRRRRRRRTCCPATASPTPARRPAPTASVRTVPADQVVVLPDDVDDETRRRADAQGHDRRVPAASHASRAAPATRVLVHAAAGGVGLLLCQWAQGARRAGDRHGLQRRQGARSRATHGCERRHRHAATTASPRRCTTPPAAAAPT